MSDPLILIPARMTATRLPGKPLADIHGEAMIVHVWRRAMEAGIGPVAVATDEARIVEVIEKAGGRAVLTRDDHPSGSDRIKEAADILDPQGRHDVIVNVQGDLPTIDPRVIAASVGPLSDSAVDIVTLAAIITREDEKTEPSVVKAIGSEIAPGRMRALYFTRVTAPGGRGRSIITSASTPIAAKRSIASSRCRPQPWKNASGWSNCAPSRTACASTSSSLTTCRSASIPP